MKQNKQSNYINDLYPDENIEQQKKIRIKNKKLLEEIYAQRFSNKLYWHLDNATPFSDKLK